MSVFSVWRASHFVMFCCSGSHSGHSCAHRRLHVAASLVHVVGHLRLTPCHCRLPHPVRVAQSVWHDATRTQPRPRLFFLVGSQRVLRHPVREDGGHQAAQVLDGPPADEPVGHLLPLLSVHLHGQPRRRHGRREDLRTTVGHTRP